MVWRKGVAALVAIFVVIVVVVVVVVVIVATLRMVAVVDADRILSDSSLVVVDVIWIGSDRDRSRDGISAKSAKLGFKPLEDSVAVRSTGVAARRSRVGVGENVVRHLLRFFGDGVGSDFPTDFYVVVVVVVVVPIFLAFVQQLYQSLLGRGCVG